MKFKCLILTVLALLCFATQSFGDEKKVTLATLDWPPYIGPGMLNNGYVSEIAVEAFKRVGYAAVVEFYPWARSVKLTRKGRRDGLFPKYYDKIWEKDYVFSDPMPGGPVGFYKRKDKKIAYSGDPATNQTEVLRALKQYKFGVVRGYSNTPEFDAADFLKKEQAESDEVNLKRLYLDRVQLICIDKFVAKYVIGKKFPKYAEALEFMEPPLKYQPLFIAFSRLAKNYEQKLKDFNAGLKEITDDGTLKKIMNKHGF